MNQRIFISVLVFTLITFSICVRAQSGQPLELRILSSKTMSGIAGDFATVDGEIVNRSGQAINNITTYISLVNADTKTPVDLEDWSAEKGLFIGTIDANQTFPLTWKVHFVQSGNYTLSIVANIDGSNVPIISELTYFKVTPKQNLNPGHVLPVALGEPILLVLIFLMIKYFREKTAVNL
jgi:hypothetical protein